MDDQQQPNLKNPLSTGALSSGQPVRPAPLAPPVPPPMPPRLPVSSPIPPPVIPRESSRPFVPPPPPIAPKILGQTSESFVRPSAPIMSPRLSEPQRVPPPPRPEVNIRTLESDISSLKASGGVSPAPKTIRLEDIGHDAPKSFAPETVSQLMGEGVSGQRPAGGSIKKILKPLGVLAVVAGIGFLGYYVIYPILFPAPELGAPIGEASISQLEEVAQLSHQSLFVTPASLNAAVTMGSLSIQDIILALQAEAQNSASMGTLKEVAISDANGQVSWSKYISTLAPSLSPADVSSVVEEDFTAFFYYNDKGVWPGYVARLRSGASPSDAERIFATLESSDVRSFYIAEPGVSGGFKTGPYRGVPVRYAAFSEPGASFNYGVIGDYAIFSSSFDGFRTAVDYLGL